MQNKAKAFSGLLKKKNTFNPRNHNKTGKIGFCLMNLIGDLFPADKSLGILYPYLHKNGDIVSCRLIDYLRFLFYWQFFLAIVTKAIIFSETIRYTHNICHWKSWRPLL